MFRYVDASEAHLADLWDTAVVNLGEFWKWVRGRHVVKIGMA
jgi:hypothetical protein